MSYFESIGQVLIAVFSPGAVAIVTIVAMMAYIIIMINVGINSRYKRYTYTRTRFWWLLGCAPVVLLLGISLINFLMFNTLPGDWTPNG